MSEQPVPTPLEEEATAQPPKEKPAAARDFRSDLYRHIKVPLHWVDLFIVVILALIVLSFIFALS